MKSLLSRVAGTEGLTVLWNFTNLSWIVFYNYKTLTCCFFQKDFITDFWSDWDMKRHNGDPVESFIYISFGFWYFLIKCFPFSVNTGGIACFATVMKTFGSRIFFQTGSPNSKDVFSEVRFHAKLGFHSTTGVSRRERRSSWIETVVLYRIGTRPTDQNCARKVRRNPMFL